MTTTYSVNSMTMMQPQNFGTYARVSMPPIVLVVYLQAVVTFCSTVQYDPSTFDAAQAECMKNNSQLASPQEVARDASSGDTYWLPIKRVGTKWQWVAEKDEEPTHEYNWATGEPKADLDCVVILSAKWYSTDCSNETHAFICSSTNKSQRESHNVSPFESMKTQIIIGLIIVIVTIVTAVLGIVFTLIYGRRRVRELEANCVTKKHLLHANGHVQPSV